MSVYDLEIPLKEFKTLQDSHDTILVLTDDGAARMSCVCPVAIVELHNVSDDYSNVVVSTDTQLHLISAYIRSSR